MITPTAHAYTSDALPATSNVIIQQRKKGTVPSNDLAWLDASPGVMPNNVISAISVDGKSIYICNAKVFGGVQPGQVIKQGCLITYNGVATTEKNFKVLTGTAKLVWKAPNVIYANQYVQPNSFYGVLAKGMDIDSKRYAPVIGGYEAHAPEYLHPLYICRTLATYTIHVGKVVASNCNIAVKGKEVQESSYQVLSTDVNPQKATPADSDAPMPTKSRALIFD